MGLPSDGPLWQTDTPILSILVAYWCTLAFCVLRPYVTSRKLAGNRCEVAQGYAAASSSYLLVEWRFEHSQGIMMATVAELGSGIVRFVVVWTNFVRK
jgi:hypothetical protein